MDPLILSGAAIIDGTGAEPVRGRSVVVEDGRVTAVVDAARAPRGARVDLDGATLLPGLINAHVHLCMGAEADPVGAMRGETLAATTIKALVRARETVAAGVTTVRDLGGRDYCELAVRQAIRDGLVEGPRILAAGRPVCMTGGHGHWIGREADGPDEMRRAVREQLKQGVDLVKLIATGGVLTPGVEPGAAQLTLEEMRAAVEEAKKASRRTAAHAQGSEGIADAVLAGITSIEHGIFLTEEIVARMLQAGTYLVPTLNAPTAIVTGGVAAGVPEFAVRKSLAVMADHVKSFRLALERGVAIAAGSDAGTPFNAHGSLVPELSLMVEHGMTPLQAIRSATSVAADLLGLGDRIGRIAPGYAADLIVVRGEPAARVDALAHPAMVWVSGRALSALAPPR